MNRIPTVRDWKVTDKETGRSVIVTTINKRFARWEARDRGIYGNVSVSVVRNKNNWFMEKEQVIKTIEEALEKIRSLRSTLMTTMAARKIVEAEDALELARKILIFK